MILLILLHIALFVPLALASGEEAPTTDMGRLKKKLFKDYDYNKPAKDTIVYILFVPTYMQPNEAQEILSVTGQMFIYWHDNRLTWNPDDYNGIKMFQFHGADRQTTIRVWTPKIIATTVDGFDYRLVRLHLSWIIVHSYGLVEIQFTWGDQIACLYDRSNYPYDEHNCSVSFHNTAPFVRTSDGSYFELRAGSITESSIQYQHAAADRPLVSTGFELVQCTLDTWYHNFAYRNGSTERPDENARRYQIIMEFVRLKVTLRRLAPYFGALLKTPLIGLNLVTAVSVWSSRKSLAILLLSANIFLHAFLINNFLEMIPADKSLPTYGWLAAASVLINTAALAYRLAPDTLYDKTRTLSAVISGVICALLIFAVMLFT